MEEKCSSDVSEVSMFLARFFLGLLFDPEAGGGEYASCWFLDWLTIRPWRWRRYVSPKRWPLSGLHDVTSPKTLTLHSHHCENLKSHKVLIISLINTWKLELYLFWLVRCDVIYIPEIGNPVLAWSFIYFDWSGVMSSISQNAENLFQRLDQSEGLCPNGDTSKDQEIWMNN
jgi:hypothetical protein